MNKGAREGGQRIAAMPMSYRGCMGEIHEACIAAVVSVQACHAKDRRFISRYSQYMQIASSRRAMQRETIPDTKNMNASI